MYFGSVEIQGQHHTPDETTCTAMQLCAYIQYKQHFPFENWYFFPYSFPDKAIWCNNSRRGNQRFHFLGPHARWHKCHCRNLSSVHKIWYIPDITHTFAGPTLTKCFSFSVKAPCCHIFSTKSVCLVFNWVTQ